MVASLEGCRRCWATSLQTWIVQSDPNIWLVDYRFNWATSSQTWIEKPNAEVACLIRESFNWATSSQTWIGMNGLLNEHPDEEFQLGHVLSDMDRMDVQTKFSFVLRFNWATSSQTWIVNG